MDTYTGAIWEIIQSIRHFYSTDLRIRKLRKQFCGALRGSGAVSVQLQRKIAGNWRCIAYAIENEVPKESFVITNYKRMQKQKSNNSDSRGTESDSDSGGTESESFEEVLQNPLIDYQEISNIVSYRMDDPDALNDPEEAVAAVACGEQPSQALKKKSRKKKRKSSSGCRESSKLVGVEGLGSKCNCHF